MEHNFNHNFSLLLLLQLLSFTFVGKVSRETKKALRILIRFVPAICDLEIFQFMGLTEFFFFSFQLWYFTEGYRKFQRFLLMTGKYIHTVVFRGFKRGLSTSNRLKTVTQPSREQQLPYYYF